MSGKKHESELVQLQEQILYICKENAALLRHLCADDSYRTRFSLLQLVCDLFWTLRAVRSLGVKGALKMFVDIRFLRSRYFDRLFYDLQRKDSHWERMDAIRHYVLFGAADGLDPCLIFSTKEYLAANDDVRHTGANPYVHYLRYGHLERRGIAPSGCADLIRNATYRSSRFPAQAFEEQLTFPEVEDRTRHIWPLRDDPGRPTSDLKPYDCRPEDAVIIEARTGERFIADYDLLSARPRTTGALAVLKQQSGSPVTDRPDVSIIVPVYGQLAYTLNCLHSLLGHSSRYSFEIIVGDDCSLDDTGSIIPHLDTVCYIRTPKNLGFIGNCNHCADVARGDYIVFLNNDTRVVENWLDELIDSFTVLPDAGLVGSKLFYPDGALQEAGGVVWQDGSAWNYGRGDDPNRPRYCYAREVDYVSGCAIAVSRGIWTELGGFDPIYMPAYYEDTDLAFRVRQAGKKVWMQPLSRVIHYEGRSNGTDTATGIKAYQVKNHGTFLARWQSVLSSHRQNGEEPWRERDRQRTSWVLVVDACNPTPKQDAGSVATVDLLRAYQRLGYKTIFVPMDNYLYQSDLVPDLQRAGIECLYAPFDYPIEKILKSYGPYLDVVHMIRPSVAEKTLAAVKRYAPQAKRFYLNADLHFLRMQRQAELMQNEDMKTAAENMRAREMSVFNDVDLAFVHSSAEQEILKVEIPEARVAYLPLTVTASETDVGMATRRDFMFLGGYGHPPNLDAALWLIDDIWPEIAEQYPEARLLIVGANPPDSLLTKGSDRVIITGGVPDLSPWFERTRLFVAPLRYGAGAKGKLLSAMAHGVPVLATPIAAEGMSFTPGKDIVIAGSKEEFVAAAIRMYGAKSLELQMQADCARSFIVSRHSFDASVEALKKGLAETVA